MSHVSAEPPADPFHASLHRQFLADVATWLTKRIGIETLRRTVEGDALVCDRWRCEFDVFAAAATPDHECWEFKSPPDTWNRLAGRAGYALVLDGSVTNVIANQVS